MTLLRKYRPNIDRKYIFLVAFLFSLVVVLQISNTSEENSLKIMSGHLVLFVANYLTWAFFIDYIYGALRNFETATHHKGRALAESSVSLLLLTLIHLVFTNVIYYSYLCLTTSLKVEEVLPEFAPYVVPSFFSRVMDVIIIIFILKVVDTYQAVQKQKLQLISLENQLHLSELKALRSQLDPHFLFNTLHTLNTLIGYDEQKARSMILKVTGLLRKMLEQREKHRITFEEELAYFKDYLDIEQERFFDRLEVQFAVEEATKPVMVPTLMLQPLIENAFKHGISCLEGDGFIRFTAALEDDWLNIELLNSVPGKERAGTGVSTKVGLRNLKERLDQMFGGGYEFSTSRTADIFSVVLKIKTEV
ncbi:sensor histidine kinase [Robertkochia flava]|uniref:sensor histidine kinase n=1 Tax=Robertkochia flava TaxID=3447986 RepID=UPI001CCEA14D|nr:histidine kinase [Robertkochia marina]